MPPAPWPGAPGHLQDLYDKGKGAAKREEVGQVLYNRGMINAVFVVEAIRTAQAKFGNKPMTGEQVRWGLENLDLDDKRIKELGFRRPDRAGEAVLRRP